MRHTVTKDRYNTVAIVIHWLMAGGLIWLIATAHFEHVPDMEMTDRIKLHSGIGVLVGLMGVFRIYWRFRKPHPELPKGNPDWQNKIASTVLNLFYGLFLLLPLIGVVLAGLVSYPVSVFGLFDVSSWLADNAGASDLINSVHGFLADMLLALALLHAAAALYHHFYLKDGVLAHMIPFLNRPK